MFSTAVGVALATIGDAVVLRGRLEEDAFSRTRMNPGAAAKTFSAVEDDWRGQAAIFVECNVTGGVDCSGGPTSFVTSCTKLAGAVVQASSGDRSAVSEYLTDVCGEPALASGRAETCRGFASMLTSAMGPDSYENRENLLLQGPCTSLWTHFETQERTRIEKERAQAAHEAEEAKRIEMEKEAEAEVQRVAVAKEEAELKQHEAEKQQVVAENAEQVASQKLADSAQTAVDATASGESNAETVVKSNSTASMEVNANNTDLAGMVAVEDILPNKTSSPDVAAAILGNNASVSVAGVIDANSSFVPAAEFANATSSNVTH